MLVVTAGGKGLLRLLLARLPFLPGCEEKEK